MCYAAMQNQAMRNELGGMGFKVDILTNVFERTVYPMGSMIFGAVSPGSGEKSCQEGQFGLVPDKVDDSRGGPKYARKWSTYNARSEEIFGKWTFESAILHRRAIIPAMAFLEVADVGGHDFKFRVLRKDGAPMWLAAIWEHNRRYKLLSCAILTSGPMNLVKDYHSRSPIILKSAQIDGWLDPKMTLPQAIEKYFSVSDSSELKMERDKGPIKKAA